MLLVAYYYPPRAIVGARRPYSLGKHLRRAGHEVDVLTTVLNGHPASSDGRDRELRARDLLATRLNWRREAAVGLESSNAEAGWTPGGGAWGKIFVPDVQLKSWVPFALVRAIRDVRRRRPDVVITTSPIESAHLVGLALQRKFDVPWVADLRDGWRFEAPREEWPLRAQRHLDDRFEALVIQAADQVVTVSEPLSADLHRRYGVDVETITNGFDPDDAQLGGTSSGHVSRDRFTLVHTGGLGAERTIEPVLRALRSLTLGGVAGADVELIVAGAQTAEERRIYSDPALAGLVRAIGRLDRPAALTLQRSADLLLLVTSGARTGEATGKLFEYLAAGPPILVLGERSEAARIVAEAGAGWAVPVRDADAAEAILRRVLDGERPHGGGSRERFGYPAIASRYEEVLRRAVSRHNARVAGRA